MNWMCAISECLLWMDLWRVACLFVSVCAQERNKAFRSFENHKGRPWQWHLVVILIIAAFITPKCWFHVQHESIKNVQWIVIVTAMKQEGNTKHNLNQSDIFWHLIDVWMNPQTLFVRWSQTGFFFYQSLATIKHPILGEKKWCWCLWLC